MTHDLPDAAIPFDLPDEPGAWRADVPTTRAAPGADSARHVGAPILRIDGRGAFRDAVRRAFAEAAQAGRRDIWCCDESFADWPLNDAEVIASLVRWARPQRRLTLIARRYDALAACHPRWVAWRRTWSHTVVCRAVEPEQRADLPTLLCAPPHCTLRLDDRVRHLGTVSTDIHDAVRAHEQIDAILQRSFETFGATTLGL